MKLSTICLSAFSMVLFLASHLLASDIEIRDPWIRAVPPSSEATAAFMVIVNKSSQSIVLTGGATPISPEVSLMTTTRKKVNGHDVMGMEFAKNFTISAEEKHILEPGGDHIMLMKLMTPPKRGENVSLILRFEIGGKREEIHLNVPVR